MKRITAASMAAVVLVSGSVVAYAYYDYGAPRFSTEAVAEATAHFTTKTVPTAFNSIRSLSGTTEASVEYRIAQAQRGSIVPAVIATGAVEPVTTVIVGTQVSGQIAKVLADYNTEVRTGDVLAVFDRTKFIQTVQQFEADLEASESALIIQQATLERTQAEYQKARSDTAMAHAQGEKAQVEVVQTKRELDRKRTLAATGNSTAADRDKAEAAYESAQAALRASSATEEAANATAIALAAQVRAAVGQITATKATIKQKQAGLAKAKTELEQTVIRAPINGTVIDREVEVGQTFAASLQSPTLFTVAQDLKEMRIKVSVDEADVGRIREGQKVRFTVDAYSDQTFEGEVVQIRQNPVTVQFVVTYTVVVTAPNPDLLLRPGMTTNNRIILAEREDVLRVPNAALRFRPPTGEKVQGPHVWTMAQDGPKPIPVRIGMSDGTYTEVSGIPDNLPVLVGQNTAPVKPASKKVFGAGF